jgi:hypothetical protein
VVKASSWNLCVETVDDFALPPQVLETGRTECRFRQTMRCRIEPMKKIAPSLRQHRELILNYFRAQKLLFI